MNRSTTLRLLALAALPVLAAQAQTVFLNETFETDTLGEAPTDTSLRRIGLVTTTASTGSFGSGSQVARLNDDNAGAGGALEYNVGTSALGSLYIQFDLFNNAPSGTGSGGNPVIFGVGNWSDSTSILLNANANRAFGLEFSATGTSSTLKIRVGGSAVFTSTYDMAESQTVKIFVNDHDLNTLDYLVPGTSTVATLGANSAVIFLNDALIGAETTSGFVMSTTGTSGGNTTGNETLGRLGFNTSSTTIADFLIDNVYASSIPTSAVPEPSAFAALAGLATLGLAATRRRRA